MSSPKFKLTPLSKLFSNLKDDLKAVTDESHVNVENSVNGILSKDIYAKIDSQLMREALINLLENAIKYGVDNSTVIISVKRKSNKILIDIENKGEVIPEKERDRIFNRFYRVDKSRSKKTGGTGLGLAIVKHISIVHNGTIEVHKSDGNTTVFRLTLPVKKLS